MLEFLVFERSFLGSCLGKLQVALFDFGEFLVCSEGFYDGIVVLDGGVVHLVELSHFLVKEVFLPRFGNESPSDGNGCHGLAWCAVG